MENKTVFMSYLRGLVLPIVLICLVVSGSHAALAYALVKAFHAVFEFEPGSLQSFSVSFFTILFMACSATSILTTSLRWSIGVYRQHYRQALEREGTAPSQLARRVMYDRH